MCCTAVLTYDYDTILPASRVYSSLSLETSNLEWYQPSSSLTFIDPRSTRAIIAVHVERSYRNLHRRTTMESLPTELKLQIIGHVQEVSTLSSLIYASPGFHAVYAAHRSEVFLECTLQNLKARGIVFDKPIYWVEVCVKSGRGARQMLTQALRAVSDQVKSKSSIYLRIEECLALLNIVHINTWVDATNDPNCIEPVGMPAYPFDESPIIRNKFRKGHGGPYPCGVDRYALIFVEEMSSADICSVKNMIVERHRQEKLAIEACVAHAATMGLDRYGNPIEQVRRMGTKTGES